VDISGASITDSRFVRSNLRNARFVSARIQGGDLTGANRDSSNWHSAQIEGST